jgi:hypothetical protein
LSFTNITNLNGITISFRTRKRKDIKNIQKVLLVFANYPLQLPLTQGES